MKEITCINCPNGCKLTYDETSKVISGNKCPKGIEFFTQELTCPKRTIATTVKTTFKSCPVLPVRVSSEIPKEKIFECMEEINKFTLNKKVKRGEVIIKNILNLGVDVIATSSKLMED